MRCPALESSTVTVSPTVPRICSTISPWVFSSSRLPGLCSSWFGSIVSYVFVPVEYYRNVIDAPAALEVLAIVLAAGVLALLVRAYVPWRGVRGRIGRWRTNPDRLLLVCVLSMTALAYLVYALAVAWIAARS